MKTCIFTIVKNEHQYLNEFIKYHLDLGIDHIFIYEDYDSESHADIVERYSDRVTLSSVSEFIETVIKKRGNLPPSMEKRIMKSRQYEVLVEGVWYTSQNTDYDWCFVIDCDEFITLEDKNSRLEDVLGLYSEYNAVVLQWENYNANGHILKPDYSKTGVVDTYTQKCSKSINDLDGKCRKVVYRMNGYMRHYLLGQHTCNELCKWCKTDFTRVWKGDCYNNIYIRHYITKSWEEYVWKLNVRGMFHPTHRNYEEFFCMNEDLRERQDELMAMIPDLIAKYRQN